MPLLGYDVEPRGSKLIVNAVAVVDLPTTTVQHLDRLCQPIRYHGRRRRGLNPLRAEEQELFFAAMRGDHLLNGFRNRDLAEQLYPRPTKHIHEQRRRTARVSRLIPFGSRDGDSCAPTGELSG